MSSNTSDFSRISDARTKRDANGRDGGSERPFSFFPRIRLRKYQLDGVDYLRRHGGRGALFWEMRLGKTITAIRFLSQRKDAHRILVVAPYSALAGWGDELRREGRAVYPSYTVEPAERAGFFKKNRLQSGWFLVNKEAHLYCDILSYGWDSIVIDETWISNPLAKVTKYFLSRSGSKYRIILTGTPAPESELQYFTQLFWVNPSILGSPSFWDFRIRHFTPVGYNWIMTLQGKRKLAAALAQNCSVLKRKDVGLSKERIFRKWMVELPPKDRRRYCQAELGLLDGKILKYAGEQWNILRRLCSGKTKEDELVALLDGDLKTDRVIVWANYVEEVERLSARIGCPFVHGAVIQSDRERIRQEFLSTPAGRLVAQPECWKFGSNLSGVDTVVFFSLPSGLLTWQQVCERTVDLSSDKSLFIVSFLAANTVEEDILDALYAKEDRLKALDRIRRGIIRRRDHEYF